MLPVVTTHALKTVVLKRKKSASSTRECQLLLKATADIENTATPYAQFLHGSFVRAITKSMPYYVL